MALARNFEFKLPLKWLAAAKENKSAKTLRLRLACGRTVFRWMHCPLRAGLNSNLLVSTN